MIEWKKLPRSIRYETEEIALDVWPVLGTTSLGIKAKVWRYSVFDYRLGSYLESGPADSEDEACERAMRVGGV